MLPAEYIRSNLAEDSTARPSRPSAHSPSGRFRRGDVLINQRVPRNGRPYPPIAHFTLKYSPCIQSFARGPSDIVLQDTS